nr:hypothetical protein [Tanacetum cinerariifolium]
MHQEEHLGFDDEYDFLTNMIPYKKLSLASDAENVSTEASAATSDQIAMIDILNNLTSQEKVLTDKKELVNSYLDDIVSLRSAKSVTKEMLQRFNMPTHTIPMLSKKPRRATADLHQDILGTRNPGLGYLAKRTQPVLYDGNTLLDPTHTPISVWDSDDVLVNQQPLPTTAATNTSTPSSHHRHPSHHRCHHSSHHALPRHSHRHLSHSHHATTTAGDTKTTTTPPLLF